MPRELRQRSSRPNYAALLRYEDEDEAGPSNAQLPIEDEVDSGSDFAVEDGEQPVEESEDELDEDDEMRASEGERVSATYPSDEEGAIVVTTQTKKKAPKRTAKKVTLAPGISARQQSIIIPTTHHRHRAVGLHNPASDNPVERLTQLPLPFKPPKIAPTNNFSFDDRVKLRVPKSWSCNLGPGPLWELMEDRGWFSEAALVKGPNESVRRPRVHQKVQVSKKFAILTVEEARGYVPKGAIKCLFGPYDGQESMTIDPFDVINMNRFFPEDISHVFNAGAPVWAIDWCPIAPEDRQAIEYKQYLAVGPLLSHEQELHIGSREAKPACIQIWSINPSLSPNRSTNEGQAQDSGYMRCDMVLCIDTGPAFELKWCPLPSNDPLQHVNREETTPRKLGLLAGTFTDGSLCVYAVPYPDDVGARSATQNSGPIFVKLSEPLIRIDHPETSCWSLDWANSEVLAVGCANGTIAVYNISDIMDTGEPLPTHFLNAHQSAIRSLAWARAPTFSASGKVTTDSPTILVSTGYDGMLHVVDTRAPCGNDISRTRDAIYTVCFSSYNGGHITLDQGLVKVISLAPVLLNKGHTILDPEGPVWHIGASDYHPHVACAVADGSVLTTNTFRNTRRGGPMPFLEHPIYQMDYNEKTKEYRMLDHFKPREVPRVAGVARPPPKGSCAWAPQVGVHRVVWNDGNGLACAPWLASATASGLCRVDWLRGKWRNDRVPYDGIDGIRLERETSGENEEDSE